MSPNLPATFLAPPPYGPEVDLRGHKSIRLPAEMFGWRMLSMFSACEAGAMFRMMSRSLLEVPTGSLPNDEDFLIDVAGFRDQLSAWPLVKAKVMMAWIACSDGRIYQLDLVESLKSSARQLSGISKSKATRFKPGHPGFPKPQNPVEPTSTWVGSTPSQRHAVHHDDAMPNAMATPSAGVEGLPSGAEAASTQVNVGQGGLGQRHAVHHDNAMPGSGARTRYVSSYKETLTEDTYGRDSKGEPRLQPDPAIGSQASSTAPKNPAKNSDASGGPVSREREAGTSGPEGGEDFPNSNGQQPVAGGSTGRREASARLNAAAKEAGKPTRRKPTFPCALFPEKIAYLWNEICWQPFIDEPSGGGAHRQGPLTASMVGHLRMRYASAQKGVHGLEHTITSLEDWAEFFVYLSTSKFLMGEVKPKQGDNPFRVSLSWVLKNEDNFFKCREGRYHKSAFQLRPALGSAKLPEWDMNLLRSFSVTRDSGTASDDDGFEESGHLDAAA